MNEKIYTPEVQEDNPFPGDPSVALSQTPASPNGVITPTVAKEKNFPIKRTAVELIGAVLNTRSKKILQELEFTRSGAIQIGDFEEGQTGDLRFSPDGIVARNKAGLLTLVVDGDTGDVFLRGTLQAGTLIGGNGTVVIDEGNSGGGRILLYNNGIPEILIGDAS